MAWTEKARAASAASRRARKAPSKAAVWRKAGDASNARRVSERGWGSGKGITKRGSIARGSNKERASAIRSGAKGLKNTLLNANYTGYNNKNLLDQHYLDRSSRIRGIAKGNAVNETGDATTSKAVRKSNRRTGKGAINGVYSARTGRSIIDGGRNSGYAMAQPVRRRKGK